MAPRCPFRRGAFYGTNPHGDVETLTDATTGTTTSTYRYTAYGQPDKKGTTGDDAITGTATDDADIVNPYRFNSARFDGATGTYDMGFREYNPGLNRFLTRDMFDGALSDLSLGTDPWNANRYMFGGGNPISRIEQNGHMNSADGDGGGGIIQADLDLRGSDCHLEGSNIVGAKPDSMNTAIDNFVAGAGQGILEMCDQSTVSTLRRAAGIPTDSELYRGLVEKSGIADTGSTSYDVGRIAGPFLIPTGPVGGAAKLGERGAVAAGELAAARSTKSVESLFSVGSGSAKLPMAMDTVSAIALKYGIRIDDLTIKINKARAGLRGSTAPDQCVTLCRGAFQDEEQLAKTLVHERVHVEDLRNGMSYPSTYDGGAAWEVRAEAIAEAWWKAVTGG